MNGFFANLVGESLAPWMTGTVVALLIGLALWVFLAMIGRYRHSVFISGGRKNRLEVIDATPIDDRRRLVLVRRDNVEHLVMIGGHNDVVIEKNIGEGVHNRAPQISPQTRGDAVTPAARVKPATQEAAAPGQKKTRPTPEPQPKATQSMNVDEAGSDKPAKPSVTVPKPAKKIAMASGAATGAAAVKEPTLDVVPKAEEPAPVVKVQPVAKTEPTIEMPKEAPAPKTSSEPQPPLDSFDLDEVLADMDFTDFEEQKPADSPTTAPAAETAPKESEDTSLEGEMEKLLSELTVQR